MTVRPFDLQLRAGDRFHALTQRGHFLLLSADGIFLGRERASQDACFVPYEDLTHVVPTRRGLWLGTRSTLRPVARGRRTPADMREIATAIEARIAARPGGALQLGRMRLLDERLRRGHGRRLTTALVAVLIAVHMLQYVDGFAFEVGSFVPQLVRQGEWWRVVTMHFLHQPGLEFAGAYLPWVPLHLGVNAALALLLAHLVEQPLGPLRTAFVLGASALGASALSWLVGEGVVIGASGMVLGLAGAAFALEMHAPERLPAPWRLPRRLFITALLLQAGLDALVPTIAGWAHIGGFVSGYFACRLLGRGALEERPPAAWLRPAVAALGAVALLGFGAAGALVGRNVTALNLYGRHLLVNPDVSPGFLNNVAWRIATEGHVAADQADVAVRLAERAVALTERGNPDYLDTLAEVLFLSGDRGAAIGAIDEAIAIAPWQSYFREQRERFLGLRDPDDRPPAPSLPWPFVEPDAPAPWDEADGIPI